MKKRRVLFIGHYYHKKTASNIFFLNELKKIYFVDERYDYSNQPAYLNYSNDRSDDFLRFEEMLNQYEKIFIWQSEFALEKTLTLGMANKLIFIPMYDSSVHWSNEFIKLIKQIKIICFSKKLYDDLKGKVHNRIYCKYFPDIIPSLKVKNKEANIYYWYRRNDSIGILSKLLINLTGYSQINITVKYEPDPGHETVDINETIRELRSGLNIKKDDWVENKQSHRTKLQQFDFFIAPRMHEGIGLSWLEAMSAGCVVVAHNTSTHNEYIRHGQTGLLIDSLNHPVTPEFVRHMSERINEYIKQARENWEIHFKARLIDFITNPQVSGPTASIDKSASGLLAQANNSNNRKPPLITVITVCLDCAVELNKTLKSILSQKYLSPVVEWLIKDGQSSDETCELLALLAEKNIAKIIKTSDLSPYDGMNQAVQYALGEYVIFMNAGDEFADNNVLDYLIRLIHSAEANVDIFYGSHYYFGSSGDIEYCESGYFDDIAFTLKQGDLSNKWRESIPCHQSVLARRDLLKKLPFDTEFTVAADHNFYFSAYKNNANFFRTDRVISNYYSGGYSHKKSIICYLDWWQIAQKYAQHKDKANSFYFEGSKNIFQFVSEADAATLIRQSGLFAEKWYLQTYDDVERSGIDPIDHYCSLGWRELRDPSPLFSSGEYMKFHFGEIGEKINPFLHFVLTSRMMESCVGSDLHRQLVERVAGHSALKIYEKVISVI